MKTYITHDDFIADLVEKKDDNVDKVIKSYKSAVLTNTLMSLALWLEVVTMVYLQLDEMSDKTIVIFIIALAIRFLTFSRLGGWLVLEIKFAIV